MPRPFPGSFLSAALHHRNAEMRGATVAVQRDYGTLFKADELHLARVGREAFGGFQAALRRIRRVGSPERVTQAKLLCCFAAQEAPIGFAPTYKFTVVSTRARRSAAAPGWAGLDRTGQCAHARDCAQGTNLYAMSKSAPRKPAWYHPPAQATHHSLTPQGA
jgi:hypothetical protein